jgi:hypothetical protein
MIPIQSVDVVLFGKEVENGFDLLRHSICPEDDIAIGREGLDKLLCVGSDKNVEVVLEH